jgi:Arc/MetJ-type ribon-helix-helix transcriptional regulator
MPKTIHISIANVPLEMIEKLVLEDYYKNRSEFIRIAIEEKLYNHVQLQNLVTVQRLEHVLNAIPQVVRKEVIKLLRDNPKMKKVIETIFDD